MEWVNAENVIAVGTFAVASSIAFGQWWYERVVPRRRRIGYRVQLDTAIGDDDGTGGGNTRLGLFDEADGMDEASVVLLRIENDGALSVSIGDYTSGGLHGMTATFDGREVHGVAVTVGPGSGALMSHFTPAHGLEYSGSSLRIPRVPLNKGEYFKLLVLLSGGTVGSKVTVSGGVQDGDVHPNESLTPDEKPPVFSRPARLTSMAFLVGIALLAGLIVTGGERPAPMGCATGSLEVTGSTAFAPVAEELAETYMEQCPGSRITVAAHGSTTGLRELAERGAATKDGAPDLVALSDGPAPEGQETGDAGQDGGEAGEGGGLAGTRLAVSVFTLLAHADVPVRNLPLADLRRIYAGEVTDWREVGADRSLPIVLVGRGAASGTRDVLQRRLLDGAFEPPASSRDCSRKDKVRHPLRRPHRHRPHPLALATANCAPPAPTALPQRTATHHPTSHSAYGPSSAPHCRRPRSPEPRAPRIEYASTARRPPPPSLASPLRRAPERVPCAPTSGLSLDCPVRGPSSLEELLLAEVRGASSS
ncbi:substrate-binding domain-containing protein [Streptomyces sp. A10(2020)]|uniref:substrate-binding domain-containing protein n=1 Tax=Streptomyces sp. A10(2020) TaxID=2782013 RepID=UPI001F5D86EC|nr:substrate-binding domain-containing protein [Streptomyces sp. A10(2020)]UNR57707.1 substrate-binding domain-containing protein [Streptomyces sp. A10(2020)]